MYTLMNVTFDVLLYSGLKRHTYVRLLLSSMGIIIMDHGPTIQESHGTLRMATVTSELLDELIAAISHVYSYNLLCTRHIHEKLLAHGKASFEIKEE